MDNRKTTRLIVSQNIKQEMINQNITRQKMSDDLQIKYTTLCDWVKGRTSPNLYYLKKVVDYLRLDMDEIYKPIDTNIVPPGFKIQMIKKELKNKKNIIKINDEIYIKIEKIERIINNE